jgi:hypothetical protein
MTSGGKADVFISYKREDEARVSRLVRALQSAGLSVWWDRGLPGGEEWRANIEAALDSAKVVLVCWTRASTGPDGGFVRDEASRAGARLAPVILERGARPPLGFGEVQAIDLSHWHGNARDPFFQDLLALVIARRDGAPAPKPKGPASRALKRFVYGGGLATLALAVAGFVWSTPAARTGLCTLPVAQPALSRSCCQAGFTDMPVVRDEAYTPAPVEKPGYLRQSATPFASEAEARADVAARLLADAEMLCSVVDPEFERLATTGAEPTRYDCRQTASGWTCAADYRAMCVVERRELIQRCPD